MLRLSLPSLQQLLLSLVVSLPQVHFKTQYVLSPLVSRLPQRKVIKRRLLRLFGDPSNYSGEVEQFLAKQAETRASIHEPLVRFDLVYSSLNRPLAPMKSESCSDGIII